MLVEVVTASAQDAFNVVWAAAGGNDVRYNKNYPANFKVTNIPKLIEFTTYNGGDTMFVSYLGEFNETTTDLSLENYDSLSEEVASGTFSLEVKTTKIAPTSLTPNAT